jgi:hypothetical protein
MRLIDIAAPFEILLLLRDWCSVPSVFVRKVGMSAAAAAAAAAGSAPAAGSGEAPKVTVALRIRPKLDSLGEKYEMELVRKLDEETVLAIGYTSGVVDGVQTASFSPRLLE